MEKGLHPGVPAGVKATQQGALAGVKATPLLAVKVTPLPGVQATIQGALPRVKATIPEVLPGDQAIGPLLRLQEQEQFRKIHAVTAPGAKYPPASNTIELSQRPILLPARAHKMRQASTGPHHRLTTRTTHQSFTIVPPHPYQKLLSP